MKYTLNFSRTTIALLILLSTTCFFFYVLFFGTIIGKSRLKRDSVPFDSSLWKQCNPTVDITRFQMLQNLLKTYDFVGQTPTDLIELLGKPFNTEREYLVDTQNLIYFLGVQQKQYGDWGYPFLGFEIHKGRTIRVFQLAGPGAVAPCVTRQPAVK